MIFVEKTRKKNSVPLVPYSCIPVKKKQENQAAFFEDSQENMLKTEENSNPVVDALPLIHPTGFF